MKQQKCILLQFWKSEVQNQHVGKLCSLQSLWGENPLCLSSFWQRSLAMRLHHSISACIFTWLFSVFSLLFLLGTLVIGCITYEIQDDLLL